jgi:ubiquinone/menaquinone biosynthesis C-methylase UbiE
LSSDIYLYNTIGAGYNNTRQPDKYLVSKLTGFLKPKPEGLYLDIGCGTGNYTTAIANEKYNFVGVEPSHKMLGIANAKSQRIKWLTGSAEQIPAEHNLFDGAIATLTIHHWKNLETAFKELYRVLNVDGKIVMFTSTPDQMKGYWLNHYFPGMLENSILQMPSFETVQKCAVKAGFRNIFSEKYFVQNELTDLFLYAGKNRPELYLKEIVRNGISSFANLALKDEVESGLRKLENDINSNKINDVIVRYENSIGDYLFVVIEK